MWPPRTKLRAYGDLLIAVYRDPMQNAEEMDLFVEYRALTRRNTRDGLRGTSWVICIKQKQVPTVVRRFEDIQIAHKTYVRTLYVQIKSTSTDWVSFLWVDGGRLRCQRREM